MSGVCQDQETGLHYNYFRDCYDPSIGRYCEADPIGLRGGLNLYAYVDGNPLSYVDPLGLAKLFPRFAPLGGGGSSALPRKPKDDGSFGGLFPPGTMSSSSGTSSSSTSSPSELDKCEADCDKDYDYEAAQCEAWWMTTGRNPVAYRT